MIIYNSELYHYGVPRRSGRYKWGSGKNPFHHGADAAFRKAKADYKANKKAINKEHRKSLRNVKDYRKVDSMVKNYKDAKRTNKEAYAQAKKAYKQTAEYKAARRKKIAGIAAGTAAVAATAYLAKHPEKRAQMSNMIKDITQGKYRPRDLSGVAKAGRPNPNLKYGRASYSKNKGLALPAPANTLNGTKALRSGQTFKGNGRIERFYGPNYTSLTRKGPAGIRVQPPRYKRLDNALASGSKLRYATNVPPDHYKYDLKNNIHSGANSVKRLSRPSSIRPTTRKLTSQTPYGAYTKRNPNHNKEPWQIFDYYKNNKKYREPGAASATGQKIYRNRQVNRLRNARGSNGRRMINTVSRKDGWMATTAHIPNVGDTRYRTGSVHNYVTYKRKVRRLR